MSNLYKTLLSILISVKNTVNERKSHLQLWDIKSFSVKISVPCTLLCWPFILSRSCKRVTTLLCLFDGAVNAVRALAASSRTWYTLLPIKGSTKLTNLSQMLHLKKIKKVVQILWIHIKYKWHLISFNINHIILCRDF